MEWPHASCEFLAFPNIVLDDGEHIEESIRKGETGRGPPVVDLDLQIKVVGPEEDLEPIAR